MSISDKEFLKELIVRGQTNSNDYFQYAELVSRLLPKRLYEQLDQLVDGPIHDGDVIGKSLRDELIDLGLAVRVCCKGEQGYTAAVYFSYTVLNCLKETKASYTTDKDGDDE